MDLWIILSISLGAIAGALLRYSLIMLINPLFPLMHFGTLVSNLLGCFLMGILMALIQEKNLLTLQMRLGISTGFLGSLTTFSGFTGDTIFLFSHQEPFLASLNILLHFIGNLAATLGSFYLTKHLMT